ncbi:acetyl-CoA acetyltransferase [Aquamicrobium defluvii]|uniref:Acetyl-CoA acetyltransferase n=1 Tax=Aquamicrobium defluvii TaxID=69279 RepID=A0A011TFY2_9HYPH|nr:hypothetical protein [Aquamicrobium defluvii]EXL10529.1 acetyl-CoA acetyltransferase [Aquamicrobium defluvii]EZQ17706.1 acetyl-CoA acetyltransferase [Halopseudomonas bauzanensis]TDR37331.1 thiolase-like protein [Aquamicrobium defluvii]
MTEAVIVSTARNPLARSFRGAFNNTHSLVLGAHVVGNAVAGAGIDKDEVEDLVLGATFHEGPQRKNMARLCALVSQQCTAVAQQAGRFDDEIVPLATTKLVFDKATGITSQQEVMLHQDECNRPDTTIEGLEKLEPVRGPDKFITAGNASQLSDGASACVVMDATLAGKRGLQPLGIFRGFAVAGCKPDEMGIGPQLDRLEALDDTWAAMPEDWLH